MSTDREICTKNPFFISLTKLVIKTIQDFLSREATNQEKPYFTTYYNSSSDLYTVRYAYQHSLYIKVGVLRKESVKINLFLEFYWFFVYHV